MKIITHSQKSFKQTIIISFIILPIILTFTGCALFPKEEALMAPPLIKSANVNSITQKVQLSSISKDLIQTGIFIPEDIFLCSFNQRAGYLKSLNFKSGDTVSKGDLLAQLDTDEFENKLKQQEIRYKKIKMKHDSIINNPEISNSEKENSKLDLELESLELETIKSEIGKMNLVSPIDGVITYKGNFAIGDMVRAGLPVYSVSNTNEMLVSYSGKEVSDLKVGMKTLGKMHNEEVPGSIVSIDDGSPLFSFLESAEKNEKKQTATIKLDKIPKDAKLGDQIQLNINLNRKDDVLVISKNAVRFFNSTPYVKVMENDDRIEKFIELGIDNGQMVEIIQGLKEGEEVIIN